MHSPLRDELQARGYTELAAFPISELLVPVKDGMRRGSLFYWLLLAALMIAGGLLALGIVYWKKTGTLTPGAFIQWFLAGVAAVFLLIPIHELIHGQLFRLFGARDVRYGVVWKKLMFYAVAHNFAVNYRQFLVIALGPFVVLSAAMGAAAWLAPPGWKAFFLGMYAFHTLCCMGDLGLCGFMHRFRKQQPLTFDDADARISYFYVTLP
ncbi:DUF3267 domain-containing protein [Chitinophaga rhizosphaerae]|uniref:DUF3267 domain-containing protein n=1 Tax=Chitinophaga rhizosphaerae TaxID=1864947 RepID=UPI000F8091C8|nr:DUF3267 domain-containing protein [Chitinophaga rhizosphaerae]